MRMEYRAAPIVHAFAVMENLCDKRDLVLLQTIDRGSKPVNDDPEEDVPYSTSGSGKERCETFYFILADGPNLPPTV